VKPETFEREVTFTPAYDKRDANPAKSHGIHGVELRMVLKGKLGATQFVLFTNWQLPHVTAECDARILAQANCAPLRQVKSIRGPDLETIMAVLNGIEAPLRPLDDVALKCTYHPMPADLGYHWRTPRYAGQEAREDCHALGGAPCYYDGSGLNANRIYEVLLREGSEGVWRSLEQMYAELAAISELI
jgi:hypothetical protein